MVTQKGSSSGSQGVTELPSVGRGKPAGPNSGQCHKYVAAIALEAYPYPLTQWDLIKGESKVVAMVAQLVAKCPMEEARALFKLHNKIRNTRTKLISILKNIFDPALTEGDFERVFCESDLANLA